MNRYLEKYPEIKFKKDNLNSELLYRAKFIEDAGINSKQKFVIDKSPFSKIFYNLINRFIYFINIWVIFWVNNVYRTIITITITQRLPSQ